MLVPADKHLVQFGANNAYRSGILDGVVCVCLDVLAKHIRREELERNLALPLQGEQLHSVDNLLGRQHQVCAHESEADRNSSRVIGEANSQSRRLINYYQHLNLLSSTCLITEQN